MFKPQHMEGRFQDRQTILCVSNWHGPLVDPDLCRERITHEEVRQAMQRWSVPQCSVLYMDESQVIQVHARTRRPLGRHRRCKWSVKMYGPAEGRPTMQTTYNLGQVGDIFCAYALHLCLKRAQLPWTTLVRDVLSDFQLGGYEDKCTLADLASHRAGIGGWPVAVQHATRANIVSRMQTKLKKDPIIANLDPVMPFRSGYQHSDLTMLLLQQIIETMDARFEGRTYENFCEEEIFEPLGIKPTFGPTEQSVQGRFRLTRAHSIRAHTPGGLWMSGADLCKFLQLAPLMPGFRALCQHHLDSDEMLPYWRENGQACMAVQLGKGNEAGIVSATGDVPGSATGVYWLPNGQGTLAIMSTNDRGGVALRELIYGRALEAIRKVPLCRTPEEIDQDWQEAAKTRRIQPGPVSDPARLLGTWRHPSLPAIEITPDDVLPQLPALILVPVARWDRVVLAPSQKEGVYDGCFRVVLDGQALYGAHFQIVLGSDEDELQVLGWGVPVRLRK